LEEAAISIPRLLIKSKVKEVLYEKPAEFDASLARVLEEWRAAGDYRFRAAVGAGTGGRSSE